MTRFLRPILAALCLLTLCPNLSAAPMTREQAYRAALPLYRDMPGQPLGVQITERKLFPDSRLTRFHYIGANGHVVPALLFVPRSATPAHPVPCLVVLHGLGGNKELMSGFCRYLASAGYATLAIDLYGHGERAPAGGRRTILPSQLPQEITLGIEQTTGDVRRGLDYLQTVPQINRKRLGLAGLSLGAIIGTVAAGVDTRLRATILVSGGGGWGAMLQSLSGRTDMSPALRPTASPDWNKINTLLAPVDPLTFAAHIAPRALLMINGGQDNTIAPARAEALYAAAEAAPGARVQIDRLPHAGHLPPIDTVFHLVRHWLAVSL